MSGSIVSPSKPSLVTCSGTVVSPSNVEAFKTYGSCFSVSLETNVLKAFPVFEKYQRQIPFRNPKF